MKQTWQNQTTVHEPMVTEAGRPLALPQVKLPPSDTLMKTDAHRRNIYFEQLS